MFGCEMNLYKLKCSLSVQWWYVVWIYQSIGVRVCLFVFVCTRSEVLGCSENIRTSCRTYGTPCLTCQIVSNLVCVCVCVVSRMWKMAYVPKRMCGKSQSAAHVMTAEHAHAHYISRTSDNYIVDFQLSHYDIDSLVWAQNEIQSISVGSKNFWYRKRKFIFRLFASRDYTHVQT